MLSIYCSFLLCVALGGEKGYISILIDRIRKYYIGIFKMLVYKQIQTYKNYHQSPVSSLPSDKIYNHLTEITKTNTFLSI